MADTHAFIVIADSSRLGTHMLEKVLAPLVELRCCHTDNELRDALANSPNLCLISNQWPHLDNVLDEMLGMRPETRLILLASPESDAHRLAQLCEQYQASLLYRPYQPTQVIREVLHRLAAGELNPPRETRSLAPTDIAGPELVSRDLAFCRRHRLPMSLLALRIEDYAALSMELGEDVLQGLELSLLETIASKLRREDSVCFHRPGAMVFSLPGTPALGARVLAHRLRDQVSDDGISVDGFEVHATLVAGIHNPLGDETGGEPQEQIEVALACAGDAISGGDDSAVLFSDQAMQQSDAALQEPTISPAPSPAPAEGTTTNMEKLWNDLEATLAEKAASDDSDSPRQAILGMLIKALRGLDEEERMALVDELLMASARPD